jgi:hypothetical protein
MLDARLCFSGSPRIGAEVDMGDPGRTATVVLVEVEEDDVGGDGALYRYVARRTIEEPMMNANVIG